MESISPRFWYGSNADIPADRVSCLENTLLRNHETCPAHVPTPAALPGALEGGKVGLGSWYPGNPGLQVVCDLTIAKESAIFRQVGPMMGSFDAGYGTWYLEDLVGKKKAKELWYLNPKITAKQALAIGLINRVVPDDALRAETQALALEIAERGAFALAAVKAAFSARHGGVAGLARVAHDLLLRQYLESEESKELGTAFGERRKPDPEKFGHRGAPRPWAIC